ncbi:MAG: hypothetical protein WC976_06430 [Caldisericia bacterium]
MQEIIRKIQADTLGPIQEKRLHKALSNVCGLSHSHIEITNDLNDAGEVEDRTCRLSTYGGALNPITIDNIKQKIDEVLSRVQYEVNPLNYMRVCEELAMAAEKVKEELPVDDKRKTKEVLLHEKKEWAERLKEEQKKDDARDALKSRFPYEKLVVLDKQFFTNGGDYGDTNTAESFILANGNFERRDMNDFRSAIAKCPSLKKLSWKPHRCIGARVYNYEMEADTDEIAFCSEDKKHCRDPYVRNPGCPGHKVTYVIRYGHTKHQGHLPVYPEMNEKTMTSALKETASQTPDIDIIHNEARNGLEVRFDSEPTSEQVSVLKQNSFRRARFNKSLWYFKGYTPEKETAIRTSLGC